MLDERSVYDKKRNARLKRSVAHAPLLKARARLRQLGAAGSEAWDELKLSGEKTWKEVKTALGRAISKFK